MTRKSTMSPESVALIDHLKDQRRCTVDQLCESFPGMNRTLLLKRLGNLRALGWLDVASDEEGCGVWFVRSSARATAVRCSSPAPRAVAPAPVGQVAAPRRIDVMSSTYEPTRGPALRAGALDFRSCPSVGYRC